MESRKVVRIDMTPLKESGAFLCVCMSNRSDGKTTWLGDDAFRSFFETGKTAVFVRRYIAEVDENTVRALIENTNKRSPELLKDKNVTTKRNRKANTTTIYVDEKPAVVLIALSCAMNSKSRLDWATHRNIYFDEYIRADGRYLKNEVDILLELYQTIDRLHYDNKIYVAGNKITRFNPIFEYFQIEHWKNGLNLYRQGTLALYMWTNKGNDKIRQESPLAALVQGTRYEEYNAGEFLITYDQLVQGKHYNVPLFNVAANGKTFTVFAGENRTAVIDGYRPNNLITVCADSTKNALHLKACESVRKELQAYKYTNTLYFANEFILNVLRDFYKAI